MQARFHARQTLFFLMICASIFNAVFPSPVHAAGTVGTSSIYQTDIAAPINQPNNLLSGDSDVANISVLDEQFLPATITVTVGTTVTWTNNGERQPRIRSGSPAYSLFLPLIVRQWDNSTSFNTQPQKQLPIRAIIPTKLDDWDSGILSHGQTFSHLFASTGTFLYYDVYSPNITGTVIVIPEVTLNAAPVITITSPTEGDITGNSEILVTGVVTDNGAVTNVFVNGSLATLFDHTFQITLPISGGNQTIYATAHDEKGEWGMDSLVIRVDNEPPLISIHAPRDQEAIYSFHPTVTISYTDFYTGITPTTFNAFLIDENGSTTNVTGDFLIGPDGASGSLNLPFEDSTYTLTTSIADAYGHIATDSNIFYLPNPDKPEPNR